MFLLKGHAKYIDVLERTLYNGLIAEVSLSGDTFFYVKPALKLNGTDIPVRLENGFAQKEREWKTGDRVERVPPMPVRRVVANEKVKADQGRIAIERGPLVYCVEGVDNNGCVSNVVLDDHAPLNAEFRKDLLGSCMAITFEAMAVRGADNETIERTGQKVMAIPYPLWSNRSEASKMALWLPRSDSEARPLQTAHAAGH